MLPALLLLPLLLAPARPAAAWESLDVEALLRRPGVKLVAVEFYATWCKPCNEAIPQWKALQERYWDRGLRLIVVSVQSGGQCVSPGWTPDQVVCDDEGGIQRRWGAESLPQAFLWSWQGHLLASHASVEQVSGAVERYFAQAPRILVDDPADEQRQPLKDGKVLRDAVQLELGRSAKFDLVASAEELQRVQARLRDGQRDLYAEGCKVPVGEAVPANSLLDIVRRSGAGNPAGGWLGLNLRALKSGCLIGSAQVALGRREPGLAVAEAVDKLLGPLMARAVLPEPRTSPQASPVAGPRSPAPATAPAAVSAAPAISTAPARVVSGSDAAWDVAAPVLVEIGSEPAGAALFVDEHNLGATPFSDFLIAGAHRVKLVLPEYLVREESFVAQPQQSGALQRLSYRLEPNFGALSVRSTPVGATVLVNGRAVGKTPHEEPRAAPGVKLVRLELADHEAVEQQVRVERGKPATLELRLAPTYGQLELTSEPAGARVQLDGRDLGVTPLTLSKVPEGGHELKLALDRHYEVTRHLELRRGEQVKLAEKLEPMLGLLAVVARDEQGKMVSGTLALDGQTLGPVPFSGKVLAGRHALKVTAGELAAEETVEVPHRETRTVTVVVKASSPGAKLGIEWVSIPGGAFHMGSTDGDSDEKPVHRVTLASFQMARSEVTVVQYRACVQAGACTAPNNDGSCNWGKSGREQHPVNCLDWDQAQAFARWADGGARLCREAEWEYAARSGGQSQAYPWGNEQASCQRAVMNDGGAGCGQNGTGPVCSKSAGNSRQGVCDLAGNVWEWVEDWYHDGYSGAPADGSAWLSPAGSFRVSRGGSWYVVAGYLRAANRDGGRPGNRVGDLGARLCRSAP